MKPADLLTILDRAGHLPPDVAQAHQQMQSMAARKVEPGAALVTPESAATVTPAEQAMFAADWAVWAKANGFADLADLPAATVKSVTKRKKKRHVRG